MSTHRVALPAFAQTYLEAHPFHIAERTVVLLHGWLRRDARAVDTLTDADAEAFMKAPAGNPIAAATSESYRYELWRYLAWLTERGIAGPFHIRKSLRLRHLCPRPPVRIPIEGDQFLRYLAPFQMPATVNKYAYTLRALHRWLDDQHRQLGSLDRDACCAWAQYLHGQELHPATRVGHLIRLRKYLDWLWERNLVALPGHVLVRPSDLPKLPEYLPRPLPPDVDRRLQDKLKASEFKVPLGLFLMRRTGLRIGELRKLTRDCLREDPGGRHYLKVPLGKLHNERLVPLDVEALAVVRKLQRLAPQGAAWLIENVHHRPHCRDSYQRVLTKAAAEIGMPAHPTTHQLRHTFATSLMNGGMSLLGIMKLLGHRDYRMTLRYTAIADEAVGREYFEALIRIAERYELPPHQPPAAATMLDPATLLSDVVRWLRRDAVARRRSHVSDLIVRRLLRLKNDIAELTCGEENDSLNK